jgi:4-hydroxy-3-methylbut-2-en-1-yl diphosphate reductase
VTQPVSPTPHEAASGAGRPSALPRSDERYYRSGLGLRGEVRGQVAGDYRSAWVRAFREQGFRIERDGVTFRLAREFGFCYGVERAVDYAYETVRRFPDHRIVLTGEIIHNPEVNARLRALGIRFLGDSDVPGLHALGPDDVVLLPAFGVPASQFEALRASGAVVVDTTCGSVLNVWKNVERYAAEGRTSIVHGKASHEETRATVSRVLLAPGAHYLVVLDLEEAHLVADTIRGERRGGTWDRAAFLQRFRGRTSDDFDPDRHLQRVGMANQTTMLSEESLEIARIVRDALAERHGEAALRDRFVTFDTICSATQERQDALHALIEEPLDLMLVIGGANSSNTGHLLEIARGRLRNAYHVQGPECLLTPRVIRHKPEGARTEVEETVPGGWLRDGPITVGLTAGASTPDVVIGAVVERVLALRA